MCFYGQRLEKNTAYTEALPPTADGRRRTLRWVPILNPDVVADATFTVYEQAKKDRTYLVGEYVPDRGFDGRCFIVRRAGSPEPYYVRLGANPNDWSCDCAAGTFGVVEKCIHILAIEAAIANNWYPDSFLTDAPASPYPSAEQVAADAPHDTPF